MERLICYQAKDFGVTLDKRKTIPLMINDKIS